MKKKISALLLIVLLLLTSCAPDAEEDEIVKENEKEKQETSIVPSHQLSKDNYKTILPYRPSAARGVIVNQLANRLDIDEMEEGLRRLSKEYFDPKDYLFEEGQYLTKDMIYDWLVRDLTKDQLDKAVDKQVKQLKEANMTVNEKQIREDLQKGLNPSIKDENDKKEQEKNPKYLSHVLEQNFIVRKDDNVSLQGVSIALAMKSTYRFEVDGKDYEEKISKKRMLKEGYKIADVVLERMRKIKGLEDIPIVISIYREEDKNSPVPGNFVKKTYVEGGETSTGKWKDVNEEYVLLPSDEAKEDHFDDYQTVNNFGNEVEKYFPNYVGVIGEGLYLDNELKQLSLEIPIEFFGKGEVIGFTQYAYGLVQDIFDDYYDLEVKITSSNQVESLIYREAGKKEPTVHILH